MANTVIRLGFLSITTGGGAGFEEYANLAAFPLIGQAETIYVALDTNKTYRWSGSTYVEISPSEVISVNSKVGVVVLTKSDIGLSNVDNTSDANKPISDDTQDALDLKVDLAGDTLSGALDWNYDNSGGSIVDTGTISIQDTGIDASYNYSEPGFSQSGTTQLNGFGFNNNQTENGVNQTLIAGFNGFLQYRDESGIGGNPQAPVTPTLDYQMTPKIYVDQGLSTKEPTIAAGTVSDYWRGDKTWQPLNKAAVGLGDVDNTSDADKPISDATQNALDLKADVGHTHALTDITQSGAINDQFPKWNGTNWVPSNLNASFTDYTPDILTDWVVEPAVVSEALDELATRVTNLDQSSSNTSSVFADMKEPTGFVNRTDSEISFDNVTRIFTIQPTGINYSIYHLGVRTIIDTPLNITIPDTSGNYYIYISNSGNLIYTTTFDLALISEYAYCAYIYWDDVDNKAVIFGDERHGITMDGTTHAYLHTTRGTQLVSGAAIGYTLGTGALDADAQISLGDMQIKTKTLL